MDGLVLKAETTKKKDTTSVFLPARVYYETKVGGFYAKRFG